MTRLFTILLLLLPLKLSAQMPAQPDVVWMGIGDSLYAISPSPTQTEVKPGWKIADVAETKSKSIRYVWGAHARQLAEGNLPRLVLKPVQGTLHDFVILKLKQKKQYRKFAKPKIEDCNPIYIDLHSFRIELLPDGRYSITPHQPMQPGEYVIINTAEKPLNELGDRNVYGFAISK